MVDPIEYTDEEMETMIEEGELIGGVTKEEARELGLDPDEPPTLRDQEG